MTGRLQDKVAIVTGGGSGIGRATCLTFAREGARIIVADINYEAAHTTADQIGEAALATLTNVASEPEWEQVVELAITTFGRLDIVCNIAGIGSGASIEDISLDDWNAMVSVNLTGVMLGSKHGIRGIVRSGGSGAIVNMSSIGGLVGVADIAGYCATKGGVTTLSKSIAMHCAAQKYPIRCVAVHPTYVDSEMLDPVAGGAGVTRSELTADMARLVPMGRVATPQDIANAVLFAASDEAAMISGSSLIVDGAQLAGAPSAHFK